MTHGRSAIVKLIGKRKRMEGVMRLMGFVYSQKIGFERDSTQKTIMHIRKRHADGYQKQY